MDNNNNNNNTFKKRYLIIYFILGVFSSTVAIIIILVILKHIDINGKVDPIALLSVNVGILQGLMALFGIGVALAAYFNFTQINDKLEKVDKALKDVQTIVEEHDNTIKDLKNMSDNKGQKVQNIENIVSNDNISKLDNIGGGKNEL